MINNAAQLLPSCQVFETKSQSAFSKKQIYNFGLLFVFLERVLLCDRTENQTLALFKKRNELKTLWVSQNHVAQWMNQLKLEWFYFGIQHVFLSPHEEKHAVWYHSDAKRNNSFSISRLTRQKKVMSPKVIQPYFSVLQVIYGDVNGLNTNIKLYISALTERSLNGWSSRPRGSFALLSRAWVWGMLVNVQRKTLEGIKKQDNFQRV